MLTRYWGDMPHVLVEPGVRTEIPLLVDNPKEVGADRIVNCLAAYHRFDSAAIVVDFSPAAICVDLVSAKGEFLGGTIATGVEVATKLNTPSLSRQRLILVCFPYKPIVFMLNHRALTAENSHARRYH
jgi:pantothenate kinase type III